MKKIIKRIVAFNTALLLSLSTLLAIQVPSAFAATVTWDGGGADNNFSTAANWSGDAVPQDGDSIVFPASAAPTDYAEELNSDIAGLSLAGITVSGDSGTDCGGVYKYYTISGTEALTLTGGITSTVTGDCLSSLALSVDIVLGANITVTNDSYLFITIGGYSTASNLTMGSYTLTNSSSISSLQILSDISGTGSINSSNTISLSGNNSGYSGAIGVTSGYLNVDSASALGTAALTVGNGTTLGLGNTGSDYSVSNDITLTGSGDGEESKLIYGSSQGGCGDPHTITLTGTISLSNDITAGGYCYTTLDIKNPSFNGHTITLKAGSTGTLKYGSTTLSPTYSDTTITDSLPNQTLTIGAYERYFLNGSRGAVTVYNKGILSGTGTASSITVESGGILAPGLSPGCLNSGNLSITAGIYRVELGGTEACTGYDQMKITGTVTLAENPTIETSLYNTFKPKAGSSYTIISNDGTDAVTGTFKDLAEGATFKTDGYVYKISYKGGDGNDVVLSVVSVPSIPDTGLALIKSNPLATLIGATVAAGSIVYMSRRMKPATKRSRR